MKEVWKKSVWVLFFVPFIAGSAGYIIAGNRVTDSLYAGITLYSVSPALDSYNIWIEIARWTAPLATATAVLSLFENAWKNILWRIYCFSNDSVAVYTDSDIQIMFDKKAKAFYPGRKIKSAAKSHIIMLESDAESLKFYEDNKHKLENRPVYIGLREIEYGLIREEEPKTTFFDINGSISRLLWKEIRLWERPGDKVSVAIWGREYLAENILCYGLLLNLYSEKQQITYHMIGNESFRVKHPRLSLMNNDKIIYHPEEDDDSWNAVREADIVIIAGEVSVAVMQALAVNGMKAEVYYYSHKEGDAGDYISLPNLIPFGLDESIYTDDNIRQEKLFVRAKDLNFDYVRKYRKDIEWDKLKDESGWDRYKEAEWDKLNGFLKWSNISAADFEEVLAELLKKNPSVDDEVLEELEHIRWCRFYYLNYWTYGELSDGRNKDADQRIHTCLCPYSELTQEEKKKIELL